MQRPVAAPERIRGFSHGENGMLPQLTKQKLTPH
jgi:hypothetical protein